MNEPITWVAIDDSARELSVAVLPAGSTEPEVQTIANDVVPLKRLLKRAGEAAERRGERIETCYEAGPLGFELARRIQSLDVICHVAAPSLTPQRAGERRKKTDRRDARKLVRLARSGELTWVRQPTAQEEADRGVVRLLHVTRHEVQRCFNRIGKFLLRNGEYWMKKRKTREHRKWLDSRKFENPSQQVELESLRLAIEHAEMRQKSLEASVERLALEERYAERVKWLCCLRGVGVQVAMILVTELHGIERFRHPRQLMGFIGLVPSEYSTGMSHRQGPITKTGSPRVRWALCQMAHNLRHAPRARGPLAKRREGQPARVLAIAQRAELRGYERYKWLVRRGKERNKIITALAREQVAFIWSILHGEAATGEARQA